MVIRPRRLRAAAPAPPAASRDGRAMSVPRSRGERGRGAAVPARSGLQNRRMRQGNRPEYVVTVGGTLDEPLFKGVGNASRGAADNPVAARRGGKVVEVAQGHVCRNSRRDGAGRTRAFHSAGGGSTPHHRPDRWQHPTTRNDNPDVFPSLEGGVHRWKADLRSAHAGAAVRKNVDFRTDWPLKRQAQIAPQKNDGSKAVSGDQRNSDVLRWRLSQTSLTLGDLGTRPKPYRGAGHSSWRASITAAGASCGRKCPATGTTRR